jgi:hypothetical protein
MLIILAWEISMLAVDVFSELFLKLDVLLPKVIILFFNADVVLNFL